MNWLVIAWVEFTKSNVLLAAPGIDRWMQEHRVMTNGTMDHSMESLIKESGRLSMEYDGSGWFSSSYNERFLRVVMFPQHAFPALDYSIDNEWEFHGLTERRDIIAFRECDGTNMASDEAKAMWKEFHDGIEAADSKAYEANESALREDYEALRKFVAEQFPHWKPMPEPEPIPDMSDMEEIE